MKKIKFVILALFVMLAGAASLSAALTFSPPSPRTGETVTFTVSPTTGTPTGAISWNFGDGTPVQSSGGLTMTHVYAAAGSYTAKASYATMSHFQVDQATVVVNDPRQVTFFPPLPKAGQAIAFTAFNFYSSCIRWDFGDATIKNGAIAESHTYAGAGNYTVHAYEECGSTYGAEVMVTVAKQDEQPPDEEPPPVTPTKPSLAVAFLNLYFAGGKAEASVAKDFAGLQAFADIQVTGNGILQWQWLVDGMVVKADTMAISFDNKFSLDSGKVPGLPTAIPGRHQVTLRFQNPKTDFAIPAITYFVGLRGPAPAIHRVTPATLAPGAEYKLELEGAELTPGTEISFPAPLAVVKKANILSPTQAQVIVFVAPTAAAGTKLVTVKNEYGESSGPGQVTIAPPQPAPISVHGTPTLADSVKKPGQFQARIVTFTCPAGGESWFPGTPIQITYSFSWAVNRHRIQLYKDDQLVGLVTMDIKSYQPGQTIILNYPAGMVWDLSNEDQLNTPKKSVPPGSGYRYAINLNYSEGEPMAFSNPFTILDIAPLFTRYNKIYYGPLPNPGECPECLILDLPGLHEEMVNFGATLKAELFWHGKLVAELGKFGKGQGFAAKLQIKLGPEALAAVKRGEEFELRLFDGAGGQLHLQKTQLVPRIDSRPGFPPQPGPKPDIIGPVSSEWQKKALNKMPVLDGSIDLYPYAALPHASAKIRLSREGKPLSGAIITIDGMVIPETPIAGYYRLDPPMNVAAGHVFNVSLTIDGVTYKGSGGKVDTMVKLTQPPYGTTIYYKKFPSFDCQWTFSNGLAPVHLYVLYIGQPSNKGFFEADLSANHCAIPTVNIPSDQGYLYAFLGRRYNDIVFDELPAWAASIRVDQNFGQPQSRFELSAATFEKTPLAVKAPEAKPSPGPNPPPMNEIIFTSPTGGETWVIGKTHALNYTLTILAADYQLCLLRNGSFVGYIMFYDNHWGTGYPPGEYTYPWQVGKVMMEDEVPFWAPCGSGYTICAGCCGSGPPPYGFSNEFTIGYDFSGLIKKLGKIVMFHVPQPGGCPECFVLDLPGLPEELLRMEESMAAGLYLKGKAVAELGKFGKGQGLAARLQIKMEPAALAAMKRGEEFELRLFDDTGKQIHSQLTRLVLLPDPNLPPQSSGLPPTTGAKPNPPLQANVPQPANPAPPAVFCADIAVTGIKATLVSTQLGDPSVDFPHDKIKLQVTLENVGNKAVPSDFLMDFIIKKNGLKLDGRGYPIFSTSLGAPGSRFVIDDIVDSFPHGVETTYSVEAMPLYNECATSNNQASLTIDETQLHPKAKQVPDRERIEASRRASELSNIPAAPLPAPQAPFVVTTEALTVTGKTPPPVPTGPFTPVAVTTQTLTVTGRIPPPVPTDPFPPVSVTTETLTVTGKTGND
jgi:hypothetical protein